MDKIIETVPNYSEGRDMRILEKTVRERYKEEPCT